MESFNTSDSSTATPHDHPPHNTGARNHSTPVKPIYINKGNNGCLLAVIFVLGFFAIFVFGGVLFFNTGAETLGKALKSASTSINSGNREQFTEELLKDGDDNNRIAIIPLIGQIGGWGTASVGSGMVFNISNMLENAGDDDSVKAVILLINSPGGGLSASDTLYNEIIKIKANGKKVVVYIGELCASGGYYIASHADYIVASPTALIGSVGVIMEHVEVTGLLDKLGVVVSPIKSSESKDIGSPFKKMSQDEKEYFDTLLDKYYNRFIDVIASGRKLTRKKVIEIANGKVYLAEESLNYGLIDTVDYFNASLEEAKKACTVDYPQIFTYKRQISFESFFKMTGKSAFPENLNEFLGADTGTHPKMIYTGISDSKQQ